MIATQRTERPRAGALLRAYQRLRDIPLPAYWPLLAVVALGLALRLIIWRGPLHQLANDEVEYVTVARDLLAGRGWVFYDHYPWLRAPLYNLFLAASLWLAQGNLHLAALPNILLSTANIALVARLAHRLVGRRAALLAGLIMAVLWTNVTFASLYMAETLCTFWLAAGMLCLLRWARGRRAGASLWWLAAGGAALALAALTRSAVLPFVGLSAAWLALQHQRGAGQWRRVAAPAALLLAAALTIAPWAARNYLAYGRVIPIETGLGYNMWAFNEPREELPAIGRALKQIANPAERNDYAMERGIERLREDPAILARKLWPNWVFLTRIKPIEDRFVLESYYLDVALPQFVAGIVLDDMLYLTVALGALAGLLWRPTHAALARTRRGRALAWAASPKALALLWLGSSIGSMLLTHGEGRYRHFLFPVLIPYAAWAMCRLRPRWRGLRVATLARPAAFALCAGLLALAVLPTYPYAWAGQNLARGGRQLAGNVALAFGNQQAALDLYRQAAGQSQSSDAFRRLGDLAQRLGMPDQAEQAYRKSRSLARMWVAPSASLANLLRAKGDAAQAADAFDGFHADERDMLDWSWRNLPVADRSALDVGDGLDFGYVSGVYPAEQTQGTTARWTNGRALLRLSAGAGPVRLRIRMAAPHPTGAVAATVCRGATCQEVSLDPTWRVYTLFFPASSDMVEIRSPTFQGGDRTLGVLLDWADLTPEPGQLASEGR